MGRRRVPHAAPKSGGGGVRDQRSNSGTLQSSCDSAYVSCSHLRLGSGFTDGAPPQYQQKETTHGTSCCFADHGVRIIHDVHEKYDFKGPWDAYGKEATDSRRSAVRNRSATINNAYLHAKHNAQAMARPKQEKSEARWRDYAADHYFHYYYRYGENEKGEPLSEDHRVDDLLELAAEPVKDLTKYKHYEGASARLSWHLATWCFAADRSHVRARAAGGRTIRSVGVETGFAFTRRRLGCFCVPPPGGSCSHGDWTGEEDRSAVMPAKPARAGGGAQRTTRQAVRRSGPSAAFRTSIDDKSVLCMPGDEDDGAWVRLQLMPPPLA